MTELREIYDLANEKQSEIKKVLADLNRSTSIVLRDIVHDPDSYRSEVSELDRQQIINLFDSIVHLSSINNDTPLFGEDEAIGIMLTSNDSNNLWVIRGLIKEMMTYDAMKKLKTTIKMVTDIYYDTIDNNENAIHEFSKSNDL